MMSKSKKSFINKIERCRMCSALLDKNAKYCAMCGVPVVQKINNEQNDEGLWKWILAMCVVMLASAAIILYMLYKYNVI